MKELAAIRDEVATLAERLSALERAVLAGGADRRLTIRAAHEEGVFPYAPRSVEAWRRDPDLRRRMRVDVLLARIGARYFTTPARIREWQAAMVEGSGPIQKKKNARLPAGASEDTSNANPTP